MTTPLPITYKQEWQSPTEFTVKFRPAVPGLYDLFSGLCERAGTIDSINPDEDENIFATFQDAIDKWTTEDSDIPANSEHVKYMLNTWNSTYGTDYVMGEVTNLDPTTYEAMETKADVSDLVDTSNNLDALELRVTALETP